MALCPWLPRWAGTRKVKSIQILLKQVTVSGSGIRWAICKSAPRSRQITMAAPHHSVFYKLDALPAAQPTASNFSWRQIRFNHICGGEQTSVSQITKMNHKKSVHLCSFNNIFKGPLNEYVCVCNNIFITRLIDWYFWWNLNVWLDLRYCWRSNFDCTIACRKYSRLSRRWNRERQATSSCCLSFASTRMRAHLPQRSPRRGMNLNYSVTSQAIQHLRSLLKKLPVRLQPHTQTFVTCKTTTKCCHRSIESRRPKTFDCSLVILWQRWTQGASVAIRDRY